MDKSSTTFHSCLFSIILFFHYCLMITPCWIVYCVCPDVIVLCFTGRRRTMAALLRMYTSLSSVAVAFSVTYIIRSELFLKVCTVKLEFFFSLQVLCVQKGPMQVFFVCVDAHLLMLYNKTSVIFAIFGQGNLCGYGLLLRPLFSVDDTICELV
jgi:hypothetical protein